MDIDPRKAYNIQSYLSMVKAAIHKNAKGVLPEAFDKIVKSVFSKNS